MYDGRSAGWGRFVVAVTLAHLMIHEAAGADTNDGTLLAPKVFRAAVAKVEACVVRIEGFGGVNDMGGGQYPSPGEGPTTGVILSADGYVLTSTFNFLRKPPVITVVRDGKRHVALLLGRDETRKICLLKVDGVTDWPVPSVAPRGELKVGQWAVAVGLGSGVGERAISVGIVSATSRISGKAVQIDANTSPANYGGPLVDLDGRVIGICVPLTPGVQSEAAGSEWYDSGIGLAVPLDGLESILERMKAGETLRHAFLGVQLQAYGEPPSGAEVKSMVPESPAAKAGLMVGDKIVSLDRTDILDVAHFQSVLHRRLAGDRVEIRVARGQKQITATVELARPPAVAAKSKSSDKPREK